MRKPRLRKVSCERRGCHLLFILSTSPDGRDRNHMSARARGEARQLPTLTRPEPEPVWSGPRALVWPALPVGVLYSLVCCPCCHFYQIRRPCLFYSSVGPWTRPTGENKYKQDNIQDKEPLIFSWEYNFHVFWHFLTFEKERQKDKYIFLAISQNWQMSLCVAVIYSYFHEKLLWNIHKMW